MKKAIQKKVLPKKITVTKAVTTAQKNKNKLFVVGIGASAGGLESLKLFFDNCAPDTGMAFVIVQHLDPTHKSLLTELIGGHTKMNVVEVTDGLMIKPDAVYIIPPNRDLSIRNASLYLMEPTAKRAVRRPIDLFFHSLAMNQQDRAIGIVLSGTGTEGTLGLKEIKAEGGITIVQEPQSAQFAGMPQSAIAAQTADYILPPEKMPAQLFEYIKKRGKQALDTNFVSNVIYENLLKKIFQVIRNQSGYDFSNYKSNTIIRRITKRMALSQIDSLERYADFLQHNPNEVETLYKDFLIGVTSFFRDKEVFNSIEKKVIPWLLEKFKGRQEIRSWVCGCSTGEEAYSLAILFREALEKLPQFIKVMIFATDIDKDAIENARSGFYTDSILPDISPERLTRYFIRKENGYQLKKEIREMVVFAHHNVIKDPPFSKMDLITCRNLLIYMNSDLQKKILPVFHYSLHKDGILILGTSESIGDKDNIFVEFDGKNKIFRLSQETYSRKPTAGFELPDSKQRALLPAPARYNIVPKKAILTGVMEKYLMDLYIPPSVIIDKNDEVLYFAGNAGQYLDLPGGDAILNVVKMAKRGINPSLDEAIKKARISKSDVQVAGVQVKVNDYFKAINLVVKPVLMKDTEPGTLIIIFEPAIQSEKIRTSTAIRGSKKGKSTQADLEKELAITQDQLRASLNELESSRVNLQTTNEEYQSSNEELQSTNEELETSREELQSVNEELITVNNELQDKIEQLSQSNDDLNNLLRSIEVATIFLDRDLKIKRFTPMASKIFNLIPSDIDRPVTHLSSNLVYKTLAEDVKDALKILSAKSTDVYATDGTWYQMRIIPYRTVENIIEGVLITFVDITAHKKIEAELKKSNEHLTLIMENLPAVPFTCIAKPAIRFSFVGNSSEKVTGFLPEQFTNNTDFWMNRIHPDDKKPLLTAFSTIAKKGRIELPFRWKCADGKYKNFNNLIRFVIAENGRKSYVVGVWQEMLNSNQLNNLK